MTDELVERVARAIALEVDGNAEAFNLYRNYLRHAQAALATIPSDHIVKDGKLISLAQWRDLERKEAGEAMRERCAQLMPKDDTTAVLVGGEIIAVFRWADQAEKWANAAGNYQGRAEFRQQPAIRALEVSDESDS